MHGQVWVSLLWGHCSFLLGPGAHKFLLVPSKSLFPQSCVNSDGSMVGLVATSSKRAYAIARSTAPRDPTPCSSPLLTCTSTGDTQTEFWLSLCRVSGYWCAQGLFEASKCLWWLQGLILNEIFPSYHLAGASLLPLDVEYLSLVGSNILLSMVVTYRLFSGGNFRLQDSSCQ